jgi:hypothetical protein
MKEENSINEEYNISNIIGRSVGPTPLIINEKSIMAINT